jgi:hypothetical protein
MAQIQRSLVAVLVAVLFTLSPAALNAQESIEKAGVAVGVTAGNLLVVPIKAISMTVGVLSGALSYVVTGGNKELTEQIWQDTLQGPYLVTPELARRSIGYRPELEPTK